MEPSQRAQPRASLLPLPFSSRAAHVSGSTVLCSRASSPAWASERQPHARSAPGELDVVSDDESLSQDNVDPGTFPLLLLSG